jgi:tetratricopeptide (TPR) repeat protein
VVGLWIHRNTDEHGPEGGKRGTKQVENSGGVPKTSRSHEHVHTQGVGDHDHPVAVAPEIPTEKLERIEDLNSLSPFEARKKRLEILTEGMDALSAAKYLKTLDGFHGDFRDAIREYAERALAENPDSFDALFIKSQLSSDDAEREAGFRRLYEMNPHSYDTVYELGSILVIRNSEEAVEYFQQAVAMRPREADAYLGLANSYHKFGYLEESLAAYQKAHQLHPDSFSQMGIDHVENDIEWARAQGNQEAVPEETAPE